MNDMPQRFRQGYPIYDDEAWLPVHEAKHDVFSGDAKSKKRIIECSFKESVRDSLANDALRSAFSLGKQAKLRLIKVVIRNEELSPNYEYAGTPNWRDDWRTTLPECLDAFEPCFILFRLNTITEWILITFADDRAPVKEKMLLAASRATFKSEFGQCYVEHEKHVTDRKDLILDTFESWLKSKSDLGPMSEVERELHNAQQERAAVTHTGPQHMKGVAFPLDRNAEDAVRQLAIGKVAFVQLSVDTLNEAIKLESIEESLTPSQLSSKIPRDKPRYTFYRFKHDHEGQLHSSTGDFHALY
uniref:ADF-H domain-containing protein n=1 Tax=Heterorhabditis bacteriophora TaxID=37862 RepID=A0A1I7XCU9_HETBA